MQTEKRGILSKHDMAVLRQRGSPNKFSGGQIENFREGWAVNIMSSNFGKAHYYVRSSLNIAYADAVCSANTVSSVRWLYGEGNHGRCKLCERFFK